jgi:phosphatidylserine decarboxylase
LPGILQHQARRQWPARLSPQADAPARRPKPYNRVSSLAGSIVSDRLAVLLQYLIPKQALTTLAGKLAESEVGSLTTRVICWFVRRYEVDLSEAVDANPVSYRSFNEFFTRPLRAGVRPLADADFVCPVDGAISQFGAIDRDQIFQAKGHHYSTTALVGGDRANSRRASNTALCHALPEPARLSPHPHAGRRSPDAHDPCSRRAVSRSIR